MIWLPEARRGVALLSAHFWQLGTLERGLGHIAIRSFRCAVRSLDNAYIYERLIRCDGACSATRSSPRKRAFRLMFEVLNSILGILLDQRVSRKRPLPRIFFGIRRPDEQGPAMAVMRTGSPVVPVFLRREHGLRHRLVCMEPLGIAVTAMWSAALQEKTL